MRRAFGGGRTAVRLLIPALCLLVPAAARADGSAAFERTVDAVVGVMATAANGESCFGTGVLVHDDAVLTAAHVVKGRRVEVFFPVRDDTGAVIGSPTGYAGRGIPCRIAAVQPDRDLALLRLPESAPADAIALAPAGATPGEDVFSIGAGSGAARWHYVSGNVRQLYQGSYRIQGGVEIRGRILEHSMGVNPGDSGSPILNRRGRLVGLNVALDPQSRQVSMGTDLSEIRQFLAAELPELFQRRASRRTPALQKGRVCLAAQAGQRHTPCRPGRQRAAGRCASGRVIRGEWDFQSLGGSCRPAQQKGKVIR
jgi:S1-C subfamily serine protease